VTLRALDTSDRYDAWMRNSVLGFDLIRARGLIVLVCVLALTATAKADDVEKRKAFAQQLTKDIARSGLRKIYVTDFTDSSGKQAALDRWFAGTFSQLLSDNAKGFVVISRVDVHRYLAKGGWTDRDLSTPDVLGKLVSGFDPDAIVWGTVSVNQHAATISLILRDPLGKELSRSQYEDDLNPVLRDDFEVGQSGVDFYSAGLDGVTVPECLYCPAPEYPMGQGSRSAEGKVLLTVLITVEGKADQIRLVNSLDPAFDRAAIVVVQSWRFKPAKDPDGKLVPVRMPVEVTFKRHWKMYP
jgi:TonB family protein